MTISYNKLQSARQTFPVYQVKHLLVVLKIALTINYILSNVPVKNHAVIEFLLGTQMYAPAQ